MLFHHSITGLVALAFAVATLSIPLACRGNEMCSVLEAQRSLWPRGPSPSSQSNNPPTGSSNELRTSRDRGPLSLIVLSSVDKPPSEFPTSPLPPSESPESPLSPSGSSTGLPSPISPVVQGHGPLPPATGGRSQLRRQQPELPEKTRPHGPRDRDRRPPPRRPPPLPLSLSSPDLPRTPNLPPTKDLSTQDLPPTPNLPPTPISPTLNRVRVTGGPRVPKSS